MRGSGSPRDSVRSCCEGFGVSLRGVRGFPEIVCNLAGIGVQSCWDWRAILLGLAWGYPVIVCELAVMGFGVSPR